MDSRISVEITLRELRQVAVCSFLAAFFVMGIIASLILAGMLPANGWVLLAPVLVLCVAWLGIGFTFAIMAGGAFIIHELTRITK